MRITVPDEPNAGGGLEIDATVNADQREHGMTWSRLAIVGRPSRVTVHGRLARDAD